MDGNVHFYSRSATWSRLCFYFSLIIMAGIWLLPAPGTGVNESAVAQNMPTLELMVCHSTLPFEPLPVPEDIRAAERPVETAPPRPSVRVKTGYHAIIQQAGQRHGVEQAMIKAIIMAESSYNPRAVSNRGAAGLMQLMPATAESMGVKDRFDPEHNIDGGVRYFKHLLVRFKGDTRLALAAYNAGARKVRQYNGIPPFKTTRSYIARVFQYYKHYKYLEARASDKA